MKFLPLKQLPDSSVARVHVGISFNTPGKFSWMVLALLDNLR